LGTKQTQSKLQKYTKCKGNDIQTEAKLIN